MNKRLVFQFIAGFATGGILLTASPARALARVLTCEQAQMRPDAMNIAITASETGGRILSILPLGLSAQSARQYKVTELPDARYKIMFKNEVVTLGVVPMAGVGYNGAAGFQGKLVLKGNPDQDLICWFSKLAPRTL